MIQALVNILVESVKSFLSFLPILAVAMFAANLLMTYMSQERVNRFLVGKVQRNILAMSLVGLVTPGLLACYLPALRTLRKMGFPLSLIAAFITSQSLVGPGRLFMEVTYFGAAFFAYRVVASFFIAYAVGLIYYWVEKRVTL